MSVINRPIIVIKKKSGHGGGHHGGAWKVAYADFVTAMMALFIVLWLMSSSVKVKKAVAGYFNDPKGTASLMGTTMPGSQTEETTVDVNNQKRLEDLKKKLEDDIKAKKDLEKLSKQIEITITPEGLRIELIEGKNGTFYQSGSAQLSDSGQELLALLAGELKTLPNSLLIEGHTDATPYSTQGDYGNWELSADRANSARRLLQQDGVRADQVGQVRGYADQLLRIASNPYDPSNRRITILVRNGTNGAPPTPITHAAEVNGASGTDKPHTAAMATQTAAAPATQAATAQAETAPAALAAAKPTAASVAKPSPSSPPAKTGLLGKLTAMLPGKKT
jgi:chemotaxis protein MotB